MRVLFVVLGLILAGCGTEQSPAVPGSPCAGLQTNGLWHQNASAETLTLRDDCTGNYSYCNGAFTFTVSGNQANINVSSGTAGAGCLALGQSTCSFIYASNQLTLDCGGGPVVFGR